MKWDKDLSSRQGGLSARDRFVRSLCLLFLVAGVTILVLTIVYLFIEAGPMARLDRLIGEMVDRYPDAAFLVTADHGMNPKKEYLDLEKILRASGFPIRAAISPVADRLLKHHGGHGGVSYIYLDDRSWRDEILDFLSALRGVDTALPAEDAAIRYRLDGDRIGDIVVGADRGSVFGTVEQERIKLHEGYRNHGSRFEEAIPLIAWNAGLGETDSMQYNLDLTKAFFFE